VEASASRRGRGRHAGHAGRGRSTGRAGTGDGGSTARHWRQPPPAQAGLEKAVPRRAEQAARRGALEQRGRWRQQQRAVARGGGGEGSQ
jgi:hypothetical protein